MEYQFLNVCMECGNEWEENNAIKCPKCNSGDFYTENEIDYYDITLEECLSIYNKDIACICDGDSKIVRFEGE